MLRPAAVFQAQLCSGAASRPRTVAARLRSSCRCAHGGALAAPRRASAVLQVLADAAAQGNGAEIGAAARRDVRPGHNQAPPQRSRPSWRRTAAPLHGARASPWRTARLRWPARPAARSAAWRRQPARRSSRPQAGARRRASALPGFVVRRLDDDISIVEEAEEPEVLPTQAEWLVEHFHDVEARARRSALPAARAARRKRGAVAARCLATSRCRYSRAWALCVAPDAPLSQLLVRVVLAGQVADVWDCCGLTDAVMLITQCAPRYGA